MRTLILYHQAKQNSYAAFIHNALLALLSQTNVSLLQADTFGEAKQLNINNNTAIVVRTRKKSLSFFDRISLHFLLKKQRIQTLLQITNDKVHKTRLPQFIITDDSSKLSLKKSLQSHTKLIVPSEREKEKVLAKFEAESAAVAVVAAAAEDIFQPISWSDKQGMKMEWAQGREYFLSLAEGKTPASLLSLLKAFSGFKKWQHSNMKLIITGDFVFKNDKDWMEKLSTYKYRDDVVFAGNLRDEDYAKLLAGAYLFVHTPKTDNDVLPLLQALQCGTPLISSSTDTITEYAGKAALLIDADNYEQLSEKMILLYKDEALRSQLIEEGYARIKNFTKANSMRLLEAFVLKSEGNTD